ncbi:MAG: flippase [Paludibacteraceae bacterium]|nr:flippase [Paludibacteraceae bacterium]
MAQQSIQKNFIYSGLLTVANYLFPVITYPYVSRVLGVEHIGLINFIDGIINYFIIFSMFGLTVVGVRAVASSRSERVRLTQTYSSLFVFNMITTAVASAALVVCMFAVPRIAEHRHLMMIGLIKLLANSMMVEWLYKGLEDFRYITLRTVVVRLLSCVAVFVFVRGESDYMIYYLIGVVGIVCNAICNQVMSLQHVRLSFREVHLRPHLSALIIMGIYVIFTSLYTTFNTAYLGFVADDVQVGYYATAVKIYTLIIALYTAFTSVMLPRMSALVSEGRIDEFRQLVQKSYSALFAVAVPTILLAECYAPQVVRIISGPGYEGAILPMRIVIPLMLVIGVEQILIIQILMPLKRDRQVLTGALVGGTLGVGLNVLLVPLMQSVGSAIVWVTSEIAVLMVAQHYVRQYIGLQFPYARLLREFLWMLPAALLLAGCMLVPCFEIVMMFVAALLVYGYAVVVQLRILRNPLCLELWEKFTRRFLPNRA